MDLKLKDVADLINVSEATLQKWVSEGKIPAYQLNNQTRFSRPEIEDWLLQQKLGMQEEEQARGNMQFSLFRALYRGDVLNEVAGSSKEEVFSSTLKMIAKRYDLDAEVLTELFLDRERMMPTGLGHGLAVPHTRDFLLDTHYDVILVVYPKKPLDYGALDGEKVHTLFFLFASEDRKHLNLLAKVAHLCSSEKSRTFLKTQPSKEQLLDFVKSWESSISIVK